VNDREFGPDPNFTEKSACSEPWGEGKGLSLMRASDSPPAKEGGLRASPVRAAGVVQTNALAKVPPYPHFTPRSN
jgi:hypothetical protein